jgi:hypothetical protein
MTTIARSASKREEAASRRGHKERLELLLPPELAERVRGAVLGYHLPSLAALAEVALARELSRLERRLNAGRAFKVPAGARRLRPGARPKGER